MGNISTCCASSREKHELADINLKEGQTADKMEDADKKDQGTPGGSIAKDEALNLRPIKMPEEVRKSQVKEKNMSDEGGRCNGEKDDVELQEEERDVVSANANDTMVSPP